MNRITRRDFARLGLAGLAPAVKAAPLGLPIGFQVYPVREALGKDFEGTLKQIAAIGYRSVEMCSPPGYEKAGFAPLAAKPAAEIRKGIRAAGLRCESCHYTARELKESLDERIAYARELGLKHMVLSSFGLRQDASLAEWARAAAELNPVGERVRKAGMQLGFHNHNTEFKLMDGVLVYDKLMSEFDPKLVKMQFQVAVVSLGYHAADFMEKYPGRFSSLHLADWSAAEKRSVPVGQGVIDWKRLFAAARTGGVKNYYVEMNMDALVASYPFLNAFR